MSKTSQKQEKRVRTASKTQEKEVERVENDDDDNNEPPPPQRRKSQPGWSDPAPVEGKKSTMSRRVSMAAGAVRSSVASTSSGPRRSVVGEGGPGAGAARQSVVGMSRLDIMRRGSMAAQSRRASMAAMRDSRPSSGVRPSSGIETRGTVSEPATNIEKLKAAKRKKMGQDSDDTESGLPAPERKRECWKPVRSGRESTILFTGCNNPLLIDLEDHQEIGCRDRTIESIRHFCRERENQTNICYRSPNTTDSRCGSVAYREKSCSTRKDFHSFHCTTEIRPLWMHGLRDFDESGSDFLFVTSSSFARKNDIRSEDFGNKFGKDNLESEATISRESKKASKSDINSPQNELRDNEQKGKTSTKSSLKSSKQTKEDKSDVTGKVSSQNIDSKKSEGGTAKKDSTRESKRNS